MITEQEKIESRKIQIRLLNALKEICDKHKLTYWLDFGTLLGAVRHKGFIPWDDDIDVSMPMEDYRKFLAIAEKELPIDIFLQTSKTDKAHKEGFSKLRDCYSTYLHHTETGMEKYHKGIYIDIFPSVVYPKIPYKIRKVLLYFIVRSYYKANVIGKNVVYNYVVYGFFKSIFLLFSPFKSNEAAQTPEDNGYYYSIPQTYIYPIKGIEFEGDLYSAPNNFDAYLTTLYGDYMTLPPLDKRNAHAKQILPNTPCDHPRALKRNNK